MAIIFLNVVAMTISTISASGAKKAATPIWHQTHQEHPDFTLQTDLFCTNRPKGNFNMTRFMNKNIHAYLDYPVALGLIAMPFVLGLGNINPLAFWLSVATGIAALVLTFFTDHHLGVVRVLPYKLHLAVDLMVGLAFVAAPFVIGFTGIEAAYFWIIGATVLTVVALDKPEQAKLLATV